MPICLVVLLILFVYTEKQYMGLILIEKKKKIE